VVFINTNNYKCLGLDQNTRELRLTHTSYSLCKAVKIRAQRSKCSEIINGFGMLST
jgi:hypothetical protein